MISRRASGKLLTARCVVENPRSVLLLYALRGLDLQTAPASGSVSREIGSKSP